MVGAESVPDPLPPGYRLDRYVIECEVSPRSRGRVYKALDTALGEVVAVTVLAEEFRNTSGKRVFRESFRQLFEEHEGRVFEYGEYLGVPYVVTPYTEGIGAVVDV